MSVQNPQRLEFIRKYIASSIFIQRHLTTLRKHEFSQSGLNRAQIEILYVLDAGGPLAMSELAEMTNTTSGAVTQVIDGLKKQNFVTKITDTKDKRISRIEFTASGKEKFERIKHEHLNYWNSILANVSDIDVQDLAELQEGVARIIKELKQL